MSKGKKVLIVVVLMILCSSIFTKAQKAGNPQTAAFFAFMTVGLLIAIPVILLSRDRSR